MKLYSTVSWPCLLYTSNEVRGAVGKWRFGGHSGVTSATRQLLEYWTNPDCERRLFFCQIEALETAISSRK